MAEMNAETVGESVKRLIEQALSEGHKVGGQSLSICGGPCEESLALSLGDEPLTIRVYRDEFAMLTDRQARADRPECVGG